MHPACTPSLCVIQAALHTEYAAVLEQRTSDPTPPAAAAPSAAPAASTTAASPAAAAVSAASPAAAPRVQLTNDHATAHSSGQEGSSAVGVCRPPRSTRANAPAQAGVRAAAIERWRSTSAAAAVPPCAPPAPQWRVGERVFARYGARLHGLARTKWFAGCIVVAHEDGTCDVAYDDGDFEARTSCYSLLTRHYVLLTTYYLRLATNYLLLTAYYFLLYSIIPTAHCLIHRGARTYCVHQDRPRGAGSCLGNRSCLPAYATRRQRGALRSPRRYYRRHYHHSGRTVQDTAGAAG